MAIYSGGLLSKKKAELQEIAFALDLDVEGTKDDLQQRIKKHLDTNSYLENDERFSGLYGRRKRGASTQPTKSEEPLHMKPTSRMNHRKPPSLERVVEVPPVFSIPLKEVSEVSMIPKASPETVVSEEPHTDDATFEARPNSILASLTPSRIPLPISAPISTIMSLRRAAPEAAAAAVVALTPQGPAQPDEKALLRVLRQYASSSRNIWWLAALFELVFLFSHVIQLRPLSDPLNPRPASIILADVGRTFWEHSPILGHWILTSVIIPIFFGTIMSFNPLSRSSSKDNLSLDAVTASIVRLALQVGYPFPTYVASPGTFARTSDVIGKDMRILSASVVVAFAFADSIVSATQAIAASITTDRESLAVDKSHLIESSSSASHHGDDD
ncbi:hypothetical protein FISHEDRAFT_68969 [Fistulina hepatica ATCC 64428]|uniref:SAP domain-containing protein n=1 Tax=Fistulina hepatica ATCC 64428 TaxID=1128425 RepID=A0A0D7ARD3_9AGAR|nr:hypothetical protein FISHEDRAFT_68969 [Fistulina hepatica ATCC 64428]